MEQTNTGIQSVAVRPGQQLCQRCQRTRRDDFRLDGLGDLNALDQEPRWLLQTHLAAGLTEKGRFPGIGFDESNFEVWTHCGDHQPRKTTSASEVGQRPGLSRDQTNDLGGV